MSCGFGHCQRRICVCTHVLACLQACACICFSKCHSGQLALEALGIREDWELSFIPKLGMSPA